MKRKLNMALGLSLLAIVVGAFLGLVAKLFCAIAGWEVSYWLLTGVAWLILTIVLVGSMLWAGVDWDH